jgi:rhamnosyltransferase
MLSMQTVLPERVILMMTLAGNDKDDEFLKKYGVDMPEFFRSGQLPEELRESLWWKKGGYQEEDMKKLNIDLYTLPKNKFDHGGTRNAAAEISEEEFIIFMTQDAVPEDTRLVEYLLDAFQEESIGAAYARQIAAEDAGEIERFTREFNYPKESHLKTIDDKRTLGIKTFFCSNVCAAYRKSTYDKMGGFVLHTIFNEDMIMAAKLIEAGYGIWYVANARVIHSHNYTCRQQFSRNFDLAVSQIEYEEYFGNVKSESEGVRLVIKTMKHLFHVGKWYLLPRLVVQSGAKYLGYRLGKNYRRLPPAWVHAFSMNKGYWKKKN